MNKNGSVYTAAIEFNLKTTAISSQKFYEILQEALDKAVKNNLEIVTCAKVKLVTNFELLDGYPLPEGVSNQEITDSFFEKYPWAKEKTSIN